MLKKHLWKEKKPPKVETKRMCICKISLIKATKKRKTGLGSPADTYIFLHLHSFGISMPYLVERHTREGPQ